MRVKEYIEEAIQDLLQARTYITTNSIPVARKTDREDTKGNQFVEVMVDVGPNRQSINHDLYFAEVAMKPVTKIQEDMTGSSLDAIWADVSEFATQDITVVALQNAITAIDATSGIVIGGFENLTTEVDTMEQYEYREQRIKIALSYT